MKFPRLVYKSASDYRSVENAEAMNEALADGWFGSVPEALAPKVAKQEQAHVEVKDDAPPTREEMEVKARELGIKFDGRTNDIKLGNLIADALKG